MFHILCEQKGTLESLFFSYSSIWKLLACRKDVWMDRQIDRQTNEWMDRLMDSQTDKAPTMKQGYHSDIWTLFLFHTACIALCLTSKQPKWWWQMGASEIVHFDSEDSRYTLAAGQACGEERMTCVKTGAGNPDSCVGGPNGPLQLKSPTPLFLALTING